jgi:uncharacterized membrane protein
MRIPVNAALHGASILSTGLSSGLLYGWTVSVIPGTKLVADYSYIETMQHVNTAIINPGFVPIFMTPPVVVGVTALMHIFGSKTTVTMKRRGKFLAASAILYLLGVILPTVRKNIPLNDALASFDLVRETSKSASTMRRSYEMPWNRWHYVRTAFSVGSFLRTVIAALIETSGS